MSFIVQPVNSVKCVSRTEYHRRIDAIARGYRIELSSTYELRTVLLKVEADVNVFPCIKISILLLNPMSHSEV